MRRREKTGNLDDRLDELDRERGHFIHFNKKVELISTKEWVRLNGDQDYKFVEQAVLPSQDGKPPIMVSTIWVGIDMSYGFGGPPLIFETGVFHVKGGSIGAELDMHRYATEEQALAGHYQRLAEWWQPPALRAYAAWKRKIRHPFTKGTK